MGGVAGWKPLMPAANAANFEPDPIPRLAALESLPYCFQELGILSQTSERSVLNIPMQLSLVRQIKANLL